VGVRLSDQHFRCGHGQYLLSGSHFHHLFSTVCYAPAVFDAQSASGKSLEIESGAADDLEYVGGGGLLLQRFAQFLRALAQFLQKARIFDGDDGLDWRSS